MNTKIEKQNYGSFLKINEIIQDYVLFIADTHKKISELVEHWPVMIATPTISLPIYSLPIYSKKDQRLFVLCP